MEPRLHEVNIRSEGVAELAIAHDDERDAVEVQQTFYEPPRPETVTRWRQEAGPDFNNVYMLDDARRFRERLG